MRLFHKSHHHESQLAKKKTIITRADRSQDGHKFTQSRRQTRSRVKSE